MPSKRSRFAGSGLTGPMCMAGTVQDDKTRGRPSCGGRTHNGRTSWGRSRAQPALADDGRSFHDDPLDDVLPR